MLSRILLGSLLGGIILFIWGAVSWAVLPWHDAVMEKFSDEIAVADVIQQQAHTSGIYLLPNPHKHAMGVDNSQRNKEEADGIERMKAGPFVFMSVAKHGSDPEDGGLFVAAIIMQCVAAGLLSFLVANLAVQSYRKRVLIVIATGFLIAILATVPHWNWWQFPLRYTIVSFFDIVIGVSLAGLVIARVAAK